MKQMLDFIQRPWKCIQGPLRKTVGKLLKYSAHGHRPLITSYLVFVFLFRTLCLI